MSKISLILCLVFYSTIFCSIKTPSDGFEKLRKGNRRFRENKALFLKQDVKTRMAVKYAQAPFAVIVACSDSRVAPEILFDMGIGELFVVRVAGNVIGDLEKESIEYAVKYLGAKCILVMGHQNCGAVHAVINDQIEDLQSIATFIKPSVDRAKSTHSKKMLEMATKFNAEKMVSIIKQSKIVSNLIDQKKAAVKSAYYNFKTGAVEMF